MLVSKVLMILNGMVRNSLMMLIKDKLEVKAFTEITRFIFTQNVFGKCFFFHLSVNFH